jgi:hypothetical protein
LQFRQTDKSTAESPLQCRQKELSVADSTFKYRQANYKWVAIEPSGVLEAFEINVAEDNINQELLV